MAGMNLSFPFDEDLFYMSWQTWQDPTKTAFLDSGAMVADAQLQNLISTGGDIFTMPFYDTIGGTADNYDGVSNITLSSTSGSTMSGVVYGRGHGWKAQDFVKDFNSGADPMAQITAQVGRYWEKERQKRLIGTVNSLFSITDDSTDKWDEWQLHTLDLSAGTSATSVSDDNKIGATTAGDAAQQACGDNAGIFTMAIMHSAVANRLAGLDLLEFRKYTDAMGIQRTLNIADYNGMTVIVDDGVTTAAGNVTGSKDYSTYLFGNGAIRYAPAPVQHPVEITRDALATGGYDALVTRFRESMHPNGFSFVAPTSSYTHSPTDAQLATAANWELVGVPKAMAMARIITNG